MVDRRKLLLLCTVMALLPSLLNGQAEREYIRKGNKLFRKSEFSGSEVMYRRAQSQEKAGPDAGFNLGDALYKQEKYGEAADEFKRSSTEYPEKKDQAESFYNLGNSLLKAEKYSESIEAYINSLKLEPDNIAAKYNLAYAQDQLKKQEQEQQQQQQQQQQEKNNKEEQQKDQQQQEKEKQEEQQQQQQEGAMSQEDAKRLLDALAATEKNTQEKVQREKAQKARIRVIKNW